MVAWPVTMENPGIAGSFDEFVEYLHAEAWFALNTLQAN
jgi:hypothetical protein